MSRALLEVLRLKGFVVSESGGVRGHLQTLGLDEFVGKSWLNSPQKLEI